MWSVVESLLSRRERVPRLSIGDDSPTSLVLLGGPQGRVSFDRLTRVVTQGDKEVTTFGAIKSVVARQVQTDDDPGWQICLRLKTAREVVLGSFADGAEACSAAARVATVTGAKLGTATVV